MAHQIVNWMDFTNGMRELEKATNALKAKQIVNQWLNDIEQQDEPAVVVNAYETLLVVTALNHAAENHLAQATILLKKAVPEYDIPF